ncbi:MAG: hypothetical protein L6Q54_11650 [Leptospiraceae bacterium]|nr:hypothetical protein [Leptospiraceae bacterium]
MDFRKYTALYEPARMEKIRKAILAGSKTDKIKAKNSIQAFFSAPLELASEIKNGSLVKNAMQFFTTKSDIPEFITQSFDVFAKIANYDNRYEQAFKLRQFDDGRGEFTIVDVSNYFTFDKLPEGAQVAIRRLTGTYATVKANTYADGLGWTYEMLEDRRFSEMVDIAEQFRDAFFASKAKNHYTLLADSAVANTTITWQGSGTSPAEILKRDVDTIQKAQNKIGSDCKDFGFGDTAMNPIIIYGSPALEGRILAALQQRVASGIAPSILGGRPIQFMPTYKLQYSSGAAWVDSDFVMVMAGYKNQRGDKLLPTSYTDDDISSFSTIQTVRARYGAACAENKQNLIFQLA